MGNLSTENPLNLNGGMSNTPLETRLNKNSTENILNYIKEYEFKKTYNESNNVPYAKFIAKDDKIVSLIDWVSYTFDFYQPLFKRGIEIENYNYYQLNEEYEYLQELISLLGFGNSPDDITFEEYCGNWKGGKLSLGENIIILLGGAKKTNGKYTNKLEMSGLACRDFENKNGNYYKLFKFFKNEKHFGVPTRCDDTTDIYSRRYFTLDLIEDYLKRGSYVSKADTWKRDPEYKNGKMICDIIHIGSINSNIYATIYDKKLEKESRNESEEFEDHIRFELRFNHGRALFWVNKYIEMVERSNGVINLELDCKDDSKTLGELSKKLLYDFIDFKDLNYINTNLSERPTVDWWNDFLGLTEKSKFVYDERGATLFSNAMYLQTSVFKIIDKVFLYYAITDNIDAFKKWFFDNMVLNFEKFKNIDFSIVRDYIEKQTGEIITNKEMVNAIEKLGFKYTNKKVLEK